jgi:uncharacterized protein YbgA (DUF1722 family)
MLGYFKKQLDDFEKKELLAAVDNCRRNLVPLIVPLTVLKHYIDKFKQPYLRDQYYLDPHPLELKCGITPEAVFTTCRVLPGVGCTAAQ